MSKNIVLLDTDIGDDIDDALALGYLGKSGDILLAGVSTVFLKTKERARLGAAELQVLEKFQLPIVAGAGRPLKMKNAIYQMKLKVVLKKLETKNLKDLLVCLKNGHLVLQKFLYLCKI